MNQNAADPWGVEAHDGVGVVERRLGFCIAGRRGGEHGGDACLHKALHLGILLCGELVVVRAGRHWERLKRRPWF